MTRLFAAIVVACVGLSTASGMASTMTGEERSGSSSFDPNSTNALNFMQLTPGREGQLAPFVTLEESRVGEVDLLFQNPSVALAFFEFRIDGASAGTAPHPVVTGDTIHPGVLVAGGGLDVMQTFSAVNFVEVRLALGAERDFDFDWTAFDVLPVQAVPVPAALPLLATAIGVFGFVARRRHAGRR